MAAYTNSGAGPFSLEFRGSTLNSSVNPIILWSAEEGLLKSNAAGENIETFIHQNEMNGTHYIDIAWFKNQTYLVANDSKIYWYNTTTKERGYFPQIKSVGSIAVDWIGEKLYWSDPKQQFVCICIYNNFNFHTDKFCLLDLSQQSRWLGTRTASFSFSKRTKDRFCESISVLVYWIQSCMF